MHLCVVLLWFCYMWMCRLAAFSLWWFTFACSYKESRCNCVFPVAVSCGPAPSAPENGQQSVSGTTFESTVTYSCDRGYTLQGDSRLTCMANGQWSGRAPTCSGTLVLYAIRWHYIYFQWVPEVYIAKLGGQNVVEISSNFRLKNRNWK